MSFESIHILPHVAVETTMIRIQTTLPSDRIHFCSNSMIFCVLFGTDNLDWQFFSTSLTLISYLLDKCSIASLFAFRSLYCSLFIFHKHSFNCRSLINDRTFLFDSISIVNIVNFVHRYFVKWWTVSLDTTCNWWIVSVHTEGT